MSSSKKSASSHSSDANGSDHRGLKRRFRERLWELHEEVDAELIAENKERYMAVIGSAGEWAHDPVAARLAELDLGPVNRHLPEIFAIEGAIERIEAGAYGLCVDCCAAIEPDLLAAYPTAARCASCEGSG